MWAAYSPVKNSVQEALAKAAADSPTHSATSGELDIYAANCKLLQLVGAAIQAPEAVKFNGLDLQMYPRIVLSPQFMSSLRELRVRTLPGCCNTSCLMYGGRPAPCIYPPGIP